MRDINPLTCVLNIFPICVLFFTSFMMFVVQKFLIFMLSHVPIFFLIIYSICAMPRSFYPNVIQIFIHAFFQYFMFYFLQLKHLEFIWKDDFFFPVDQPVVPRVFVQQIIFSHSFENILYHILNSEIYMGIVLQPLTCSTVFSFPTTWFKSLIL